MAVAPAEPPTGASSSSSSSSPAIRVLETIVVPPSPGPALPETSLQLTFFDVIWLHSPPVERLFLYRLDGPDAAEADAIVSRLKTSLSEAVRAFYPLAGLVRLTAGTADRYELHYRPGDGVAFTVAESDDDVDGLVAADGAARAVARLAPLVPPLPDVRRALLAVQATVLSRRRGIAVGVAVHHAACDGSASTHFLHTWAAAAACREPVLPPVVDRSGLVTSDPGGRFYDAVYRGRQTREEMEFVKMSPDKLLATFVLSAEDLRRVKAAVAAEAGSAAPPPRCSSLVATLGLVWSCYHRAAKKDGEEQQGQGQPTCLLFPVDHRSRMRPPVPDKYLGNCVGPAFAVASKAELTQQPPGAGLFAACAAVSAAIQEAVTDIVGTPAGTGIEAWMDRVREVGRTGVLSVAGSPRFRVYDLDFGFGKPAKVDIVSVARTGAVALAESPNGDGGLEVGVSLRPDGMERFRECFADAMAWLAAHHPIRADDK